MATRRRARGDAEDRQRQMLAVEHRHDRMDRADVRMLALAPAHHLRPAQTFDDLRHALLKDLAGRTAFDRSADADVVGRLGVGGRGSGVGVCSIAAPTPGSRLPTPGDHVVESRVVLFQKPAQRLRRFPLGVVRGLHRRTFHLFVAIVLAQRNVRQKKDEAPRRAVDDDRIAILRLLAEVERQFRQLLEQRGLRGVVHPRRDLFRQQLEKVLSHGMPSAAEIRALRAPRGTGARTRRPARERV